ncbi:broad specificity phosphatase PhoE [Labrenzia sp. EL_159]|nr:broad specificity phosphatase PhoE [Labrenzia sp. EL_142]MBG6154165.1 broad specificity phosphatase PhoE [Labrenzia sp. EL_162]MBG6193706.1 broad specificity phosphatase PhoE [Labrenzia sp. EL_159]
MAGRLRVMTWCIYLTHPEVAIDPSVPVPEWGLSPLGQERAAKATDLPFAKEIGAVVTSAETKAIETARFFTGKLDIPLHTRQDLHENDRSATGFLPPDEFEQVANRFFAEPQTSVRGWERAEDAQNRIVGGIRDVLSGVARNIPVLFTGHGAAGTLLMCHLMGRPISRAYDQKRGGCWYRFEKDWLSTQTGSDLSWIEV